jgi:hypothetical protein
MTVPHSGPRERTVAPAELAAERERIERLNAAARKPARYSAEAKARRPAAAAGPFETERQALDRPAVRAAYAAITGPGTGTLESLAILEDALSAAGVELGAYDRRIVNWLAGRRRPAP